jgi:hypothetical protein
MDTIVAQAPPLEWGHSMSPVLVPHAMSCLMIEFRELMRLFYQAVAARMRAYIFR